MMKMRLVAKPMGPRKSQGSKSCEQQRLYYTESSERGKLLGQLEMWQASTRHAAGETDPARTQGQMREARPGSEDNQFRALRMVGEAMQTQTPKFLWLGK